MTHPVFNWLTVSPESWHKSYCRASQRCGECHGDVADGTLGTNARGQWEHFACAKAAYERVHAEDQLTAASKVELTESGTQADLLSVIRRHGVRVIVEHHANAKRDQRFHWSELA